VEKEEEEEEEKERERVRSDFISDFLLFFIFLLTTGKEGEKGKNVWRRLRSRRAETGKLHHLPFAICQRMITD